MAERNERATLSREQAELIIRLDERVKELEKELHKLNTNNTVLINEIKQDIKANYVSKGEFGPVQKSVYTAIGFFFTAFVGLLVSYVFGKPGSH